MKNNTLIFRTVIILAITLFGLYLVFGPRGNVSADDFTPQGIRNNLSENINLGLDLKGGTQLVMRVKTDDYLKNSLKKIRLLRLELHRKRSCPLAIRLFLLKKVTTRLH